MKTLTTLWRSAALLAAALLLQAGALSAQSQSGNLFGVTKDDKGAALPGVTVTLSGQGAPQTQSTDADGQFHFLGLSPGSYALKAELQGFSTVDYPNVVVSVGRNTNVEVKLAAAVEDVITVTAESPLLDERKIGSSTTVSQTELSKIPTARDPWALLQSTPGVLTDRINVGGNESGQQAALTGPGSMGAQATFALDGMVITDMTAAGASPGYYDFDSFEEMQITTGGSDTTVATPGVTLNMVTKRGTNELRGSGRYYYTDDSLQSNLAFSQGELAKAGSWNKNHAQSSFKQGNRISKIEDWGLELGGPLVKDKLWLWGSYSKPKIDLLTVSDFFDKTTLEDYNAKLNWQVTQANALTAFVWDSNKVKLGRNAGPSRPQETTFDQSKFGPSPTAYKAEDTHIFSSNLYLTGLYSKVNGGFQLVPEGGDRPFYQDAGGVWHKSFFLGTILRPQEQLKLDSSVFFNTGALGHELKFGAGHRTAGQESLSRTQGGYYEQSVGNFGRDPAEGSLYNLGRDSIVNVDAKYDSVYVQDTLTAGALTANVGLRYDKQGGKNNAQHIDANRWRPDLLPAVDYAGGGAGFEWKTLTPRLGLTYALGAERKTLLRASFAQFADQLPTGFISQTNPLLLQGYAYLYGPTLEAPATLPGGLELDSYSGNVNPFTGGLVQSNAVDKDFNAPITNELLLSVEHALLPELVLGFNVTYRRLTNLLEQDLLVFDGDAHSQANLANTGRRNRRDDYVQRDMDSNTPGVQNLTGVDPHGNAYSIPIYQLRPGVTSRGGNIAFNGDRTQDYKGASLLFTKRLSNRWMLRGNVSYSDWTWNTPDSERENPTLALDDDGQPVLQNTGNGSGSKGNVWLNSKWSYSVNGLYQVAPDRAWGFDVGANLSGRQGYPVVYLRNIGRLNLGGGNIQQPVTSSSDRYRQGNIQQLDLRLAKDFRLADFGFTVSADCFNVFNRATVLQRRGVLNANNSDFVQEIVSPRLFRVGLQMSFR